MSPSCGFSLDGLPVVRVGPTDEEVQYEALAVLVIDSEPAEVLILESPRAFTAGDEFEFEGMKWLIREVNDRGCVCDPKTQ